MLKQHSLNIICLVAFMLITGITVKANDKEDIVFKPAPKGWPESVKTVKYPTSIDKTMQPMLVYTPKTKEKRPLLVGLHTWSGNYTQAGGETVYARWCIKNNWYFIHPDFRGPNRTPNGCGSEKAVQDIIDAVDFMKKHYDIDTNRIYLVGASGGGYMSLLMAGRAPEIWAGVSAWVPISDIRKWWEQKKGSHYAKHIEKATGGQPDQNPKAAEECVKRSAITYLDKAASVNLDINAGVKDGRGGSVPFTHSLYAFNKVVADEGRLPTEFIETFYETQKLPPTVKEAEVDDLYGNKKVIFRKVYKNTRVTIFKGGHEIIRPAALNWLAAQRKNKPANWTKIEKLDLKSDKSEDESGK
jgi:acetyl esterase/lipase